ncbi:MAG: hypothetical protein WC609_01880 [Candidatus Paceibacterota bacterium]|jgi:hypothetical protein
MNQNAKKIIKIAGFSVFFILIIIYAFFVSKDLVFGIKINNVNLTDGTVVTDSVFEITGNARNAINLTLGGREISVSGGGDFNETIALLPGYNIINIKAVDKFGCVDEKNYKLIYKENTPR